MKKALEVNVDDLYTGGVFSLVKSVIVANHGDVKIDIGAIERFVNPENVDMFKSYNCDVIDIGSNRGKIRKQIDCYKKTRKTVEDGEYEYVHIHSDLAYKMIAPGIAAKKAGARRVILHAHAAGVDGKYRKAKMIIHRITRLFLKRIGTDYIACSDLAAQFMFPNKIHSKVKLIRNGINLSQFRYNPEIRAKMRAELSVDSEFLIGHIGRFAYQKNHEYILSVLEACLKKGLQIKLLLIGEGPKEQRIYKLAKEKNLKEHIIFYGTSDHVHELLQAMDVFVLPSHFEGLPIVGVEAQAAGLPTLLSDRITREAGLLPSTKFIGIRESDIDLWAEAIIEKLSYARVDTYNELRKQKFDIQDTVDSFLSLYN